jgi:hypothetical protein
MTSAIDATKPADAVPASKADLRANLAAAKAEIEALQRLTATLSPYALTGSRNRIHNPLFRMNRRNGTGLTNFPAGTAPTFGVDRWYGSAIAGGGGFSVQTTLTGGPAGVVSYVRLATVTAKGSLAAGDYHYFAQAIEGTDFYDLQWGTASAVPAVLTFWVRASIAGTYSLALHSPAFAQSYVATYSVTLANTWQFVTISIAAPSIGTWPTTAVTTGGIKFDLGQGTTFSSAAGVWVAGNKGVAPGSVAMVSNALATLDIAQIQLEPGTTATAFDRRPDPIELIITGRYYESSQFNLAGYQLIGGAVQQFIPATIYKRASPNVTLVGSATVNVSGATTTPVLPQGGFLLSGTATATGSWSWVAAYSMECELTI